MKKKILCKDYIGTYVEEHNNKKDGMNRYEDR